MDWSCSGKCFGSWLQPLDWQMKSQVTNSRITLFLLWIVYVTWILHIKCSYCFCLLRFLVELWVAAKFWVAFVDANLWNVVRYVPSWVSVLRNARQNTRLNWLTLRFVRLLSGRLLVWKEPGNVTEFNSRRENGTEFIISWEIVWGKICLWELYHYLHILATILLQATLIACSKDFAVY